MPLDRELVPVLSDALERTGTIIEAIGADRYGQPSVCTGWTMGELVSHLIATIDKFTRYANGATTAPRTATPSTEQVCHAGYVATAAAAHDAWQSVTDLPLCALPFGIFDCSTALGIVIFDVVIHGFDLAQSSDQRYDVDSRTGTIVYEVATVLVTPAAIAGGHYSQVADQDGSGMSDFGAALRLTGRTG